jgi:ribonuclease P protein component
MKKENRLLKNRDFKVVLDARKSVACGEYVVYKKKNELSGARIGISVSSKIGNSVVRHKIKRQISEMLKEIFDLGQNIDIVIIVRNKFLSNDFAKNKDVLNNLLNKKIERS